MTDVENRGLASRLRADFDEAFALPPPPLSPPQLDLLLVGVAGQRYALLLPQVRALYVDRKLTEAPSPRRELLGLIGVLDTVIPVYDLSLLLGYPAASAPRFFVQVEAPSAFAVAFEHFERHVRVAQSAVAAASPGASGRPEASGSVRTPSGSVTTIDLIELFERVRKGQPLESTRREQEPQT